MIKTDRDPRLRNPESAESKALGLIQTCIRDHVIPQDWPDAISIDAVARMFLLKQLEFEEGVPIMKFVSIVEDRDEKLDSGTLKRRSDHRAIEIDTFRSSVDVTQLTTRIGGLMNEIGILELKYREAYKKPARDTEAAIDAYARARMEAYKRSTANKEPDVIAARSMDEALQIFGAELDKGMEIAERETPIRQRAQRLAPLNEH